MMMSFVPIGLIVAGIIASVLPISQAKHQEIVRLSAKRPPAGNSRASVSNKKGLTENPQASLFLTKSFYS
jgi:hypothetical protein